MSGGNTHSMRVAKLLLGLNSLSPSETLCPANGETSPRRRDQASRAGPKGCASLGKGCFSAKLQGGGRDGDAERPLGPAALPRSIPLKQGGDSSALPPSAPALPPVTEMVKHLQMKGILGIGEVL